MSESYVEWWRMFSGKLHCTLFGDGLYIRIGRSNALPCRERLLCWELRCSGLLRVSSVNSFGGLFNLHPPTNALIYNIKFKIYIKTLKTLLHISIIRSSSGSADCSLLKLYIKTISDVLRYLNLVWCGSTCCRYSVVGPPTASCHRHWSLLRVLRSTNCMFALIIFE